MTAWPTPPEPIRRIVGAWFLWLLATLLAALLVSQLARLALQRLDAPPLTGGVLAVFAGVAAGQLVWLGAAWRGLRRLPPVPPERRLGGPARLGLVLLCLLAGAALTRLAWPDPAPLPTPQGAAQAAAVLRESQAHPGLALATSLFVLGVMVGLAPLAEELAFRHWLWRRLACRPAATRGLVTGGLWILAHLRGPGGMLALLPLALLLGWARQRSGSPGLCVAMHAAWNCGVAVSASLQAGLG
ncbi:CPBP family intramembrane glutamic endopeptidase [Roseicella frigidaeris]|uniref:CAAX prenyl protease 2/Lysostaphin resistance protein A-like domain-containing protein n=1 Tax=Roseicella frigidaeris TaxID=2230885 RepID=A0A327MFA3_9PROT|nr:CPBP family intramembrane glutamic endopeptidase [Roseicella frigidaeris]RAI60743.1 hypothetical protein DOO78_01015 [Roseicella frigidaeris]